MIYDYYELVSTLIDPENEYEGDEYLLEHRLYDVYGIDFDNFVELINDLLPLCHDEVSVLTGKHYRGFGSGKFWIVKQEIE